MAVFLLSPAKGAWQGTEVRYGGSSLGHPHRHRRNEGQGAHERPGRRPEAGLRVAVRGGGCSGFQYALAFDEQRDGDQIFEHGGIRLLIDSESLPFVDGSEVDYVESLQGAGFSVNNPKVVAACGCGQSFRTA